MRRSVIALLACWALVNGYAFSQEREPFLSEETEDAPEYSPGKQYFKMIISLGGVLGLAVVTVWFLGRLSRQRLAAGNSNTVIKIVERRALNQKSAIYVLDILGRGVVVAISPSGVQTITEFPIGTDLEGLMAQTMAQTPRFSFSDILRKALTRKA